MTHDSVEHLSVGMSFALLLGGLLGGSVAVEGAQPLDQKLRTLQDQIRAARKDVRVAKRDAVKRHQGELREDVDAQTIRRAEPRLRYVRALASKMGSKRASRGAGRKKRRTGGSKKAAHRTDALITSLTLEYRGAHIQGIRYDDKTVFNIDYPPPLLSSTDIERIQSAVARMSASGNLEDALLQALPGFHLGAVHGQIRTLEGTEKFYVEVRRDTKDDALVEAERAVKVARWVPAELIARQKAELRGYAELGTVASRVDSRLRKAKAKLESDPDQIKRAMSEYQALVDDAVARIAKGLDGLRRENVEEERQGRVFLEVWGVTAKRMRSMEVKLKQLSRVASVRGERKSFDGKFEIGTDDTVKEFAGRLAGVRWPRFSIAIKEQRMNTILAVLEVAD